MRYPAVPVPTVSFEPNATQNTAHHMLLYGCEQPGTDDAVWSCGDMAVNDPSKKSGPICRGTSQVASANHPGGTGCAAAGTVAFIRSINGGPMRRVEKQVVVFERFRV